MVTYIPRNLAVPSIANCFLVIAIIEFLETINARPLNIFHVASVAIKGFIFNFATNTPFTRPSKQAARSVIAMAWGIPVTLTTWAKITLVSAILPSMDRSHILLARPMVQAHPSTIKIMLWESILKLVPICKNCGVVKARIIASMININNEAYFSYNFKNLIIVFNYYKKLFKN